MLNLVKLGLNYLPLLLIVPKMRSFFISGEIIRFDRKENFTSDFKEDLRFEEAPSTKNNKTEQKHGRAPQGKYGSQPDIWHGHPVPGSTTVLLCTGRLC